MKKIIILIATTVFSVISANAQKSANYVSLAQSSNDTIQYLNNNFISQKAKYINQPLSKIFNDLEVKILDVSPIRRSAPGTTGIDARYLKGIDLTFINIDGYLNKPIDQRELTEIYSLIIYTKDLLLWSDYKPLIYSEPETIDTDVKALFSGSNYLVGDLEVSPYYNTPQSSIRYRNNCGIGGVGSAMTFTIPAKTYFSIISQADADAIAMESANYYSQLEVNKLGTCTYSSSEKSGYIRKNDCPTGSLGNSVKYVVPAGKHTSSISQADADAKALTDFNTDGQTYANTIGSCLYKSKALTNVGFRKACIAPKVGTIVYYSALAGKFISYISQADADLKATQAGQANANTKGTCN